MEKMEEICETCNYKSTIHRNFLRHVCKSKTDYQCYLCEKYYKTLDSLNDHKTRCINKIDIFQKLKEKIDEIKHLKSELAELKADVQQQIIQSQTNIQSQNNIQNQSITNNNNNIVNIVLPHKTPSLDHLTDEDYFNLLGRSLMSIPLMIEKIHFNKDVPENHNIYIPDIKNKYAMLYNGMEWSLHNKDEIIDNMIADNEMRLEDWLSREDIQEKYPVAFKRFEFYLKLKEKSANVNRMKEDVLLVLYNKRNMIKN